VPHDPDNPGGLSSYELYVLGLDRVATEWDRIGPLLADAARLVDHASIGADLGFEETAPECQAYDALRSDLSRLLTALGDRYTTEATLLRTLDATYHRVNDHAASGYRSLARSADAHGPL
jgi:hypothetical protein